jgi:hypothetical protein
MIARLEDQKKLIADPNFVRTVKRWERKEGGEQVLVEKRLRSNKWWQLDQTGGYVMTVKVGSKRTEFEKGQGRSSPVEHAQPTTGRDACMRSADRPKSCRPSRAVRQDLRRTHGRVIAVFTPP